MNYRILQKKGMSTGNSSFFIQYHVLGSIWFYVKQNSFGRRIRARFSKKTDAMVEALKLKEKKKIIIHNI